MSPVIDPVFLTILRSMPRSRLGRRRDVMDPVADHQHRDLRSPQLGRLRGPHDACARRGLPDPRRHHHDSDDPVILTASVFGEPGHRRLVASVLWEAGT